MQQWFCHGDQLNISNPISPTPLLSWHRINVSSTEGTVTPKNGLTEGALYQATFTNGMPHNTSSTGSDPPYPLSLIEDQRASQKEALLLAKDTRLKGNTINKDTKDPSNNQTKATWWYHCIRLHQCCSLLVSHLCPFTCLDYKQVSAILHLHREVRLDSPHRAVPLSSHSNYRGRLRHLSSEWKCLCWISWFRRDKLCILPAINILGFFFSLCMHSPHTTTGLTLLGSTTVWTKDGTSRVSSQLARTQLTM